MMEFKGLFRKIWEPISNEHPVFKLVCLNIVAILRGYYARLKFRNLLKSPALENLVSNTSYFTRINGLSQALYFETITDYAQNGIFRKERGFDKEYLPLWHLAAIDFLKTNVPRDAAILDICCGMGHFFVFLAQEGFHNFSGLDNSLFQPRIIKAAKDFLRHYSVSPRFYDFDVSYPGYYHHLKENFDVVTYFGVGYHYLFGISYDLLKPGGYFIYDTFEKAWGGIGQKSLNS